MRVGLGISREGWIGKEADRESELGDFGVRKYAYRSGRFLQPEPLWEQYYGWSVYQYGMNNPLRFEDRRGTEWYDVTGNGNWVYLENTPVTWVWRQDEEEEWKMTEVEGLEELLFFDGRHLWWLAPNGQRYRWRAYSGKYYASWRMQNFVIYPNPRGNSNGDR